MDGSLTKTVIDQNSPFRSPKLRITYEMVKHVSDKKIVVGVVIVL
jgi:hypothetical protein